MTERSKAFSGTATERSTERTGAPASGVLPALTREDVLMLRLVANQDIYCAGQLDDLADRIEAGLDA